MNINGLGLDLQSFFQKYSSQSLMNLNSFFGKEPYEPPKILVIPYLASQYILSAGLHIALCCHPQGWTGH